MDNDDKIIELTDEAKEKPVVELKQEPERAGESKLEESKTDLVICQLNEKIEQAEESGSYFVIITRKEGEKLKHWMGSVNFPKDDKAHSLRELLKQVPTAYKETGKVRRFAPRKHGD